MALFTSAPVVVYSVEHYRHVDDIITIIIIIIVVVVVAVVLVDTTSATGAPFEGAGQVETRVCTSGCNLDGVQVTNQLDRLRDDHERNQSRPAPAETNQTRINHRPCAWPATLIGASGRLDPSAGRPEWFR